jgi:hypothetical protein
MFPAPLALISVDPDTYLEHSHPAYCERWEGHWPWSLEESHPGQRCPEVGPVPILLATGYLKTLRNSCHASLWLLLPHPKNQGPEAFQTLLPSHCSEVAGSGLGTSRRAGLGLGRPSRKQLPGSVC